MPAAGRKPIEGQKLGRTPPTTEWTQVPNLPYRGRKPALPRARTVATPEGATEIPLAKLTRAWWRDVSSMPHCKLWSTTDWRFAIETALIADAFFQGDRVAATELRLRERILGTTIDARRDLRIRYVSIDEPPPDDAGPKRPATVTQLGDRRERLLTGDAD